MKRGRGGRETESREEGKGEAIDTGKSAKEDHTYGENKGISLLGDRTKTQSTFFFRSKALTGGGC